MKQFLSFAIFICLYISAQAQKCEIIYDFNLSQFVDNDYVSNGKIKLLPMGSFATIKVININTFRWKVQIEGRSINYVTQIPSELQTLFRLPDQEEVVQKTQKAVGDIKSSAESMNALATELKEAPTSNLEVPGVATVEDKKKHEEDKVAFEKAMDRLVDACEQYVLLAEKMADIKFTRMRLIAVSKQKWASYNDMEPNLPTLLSERQMRDNYNKFVTYYARAYTLYEAASKAAEKYKAEDAKKRVEEAEARIKKGNDEIYEVNFLKLIEDVSVLQDAMQNENYFTVASGPIQVDGDYIAFTIKTTPTKTNDLLAYEPAKDIQMELPAKGGWKADFSVGPVLSFGNGAKDDTYFLREKSATEVELVKQDNNNVISPGIAAMMHFGTRVSSGVGAGLLFGVGAGFQSESNINANIYLGGSVVFGKREKIMLSTGCSWLRVNRVKNKQYTEGGVYETDKIDLGDITEKVFKPSVFFSISYNLTNRVEIK